MTNYPCLTPACATKKKAEYVAKDNRATYGHICEGCFKKLSPEAQRLYAATYGTRAVS